MAAPVYRSDRPGPFGPTPELRISATTFDKWDGCPRQWGYVYNEGYREVTGATELGTRVHKILEDYQKLGTLPDLSETLLMADKYKLTESGAPKINTYYPGQIAHQLLGLIPKPGTALSEFAGTVKTQSLDWTLTLDLAEVRDLPTVSDYKTTSKPRNETLRDVQHKVPPGSFGGPIPHLRNEPDLTRGYAWKTPEVLSIDSQANLYSAFLSEKTGSPNIGNRWYYTLTKLGDYDAWVSELVSTPKMRLPVLDRMDAGGVDMVRAYEAQTPALALPPNPEQCDKYGGCIHKKENRCMLSIAELLNTKGSTMDNFDSFLKSMEGTPGTPPALPGATSPAVFSVVPNRPAYWVPGDPMNDDQNYFAGKGKPLYYIATLADNPPPQSVIDSMMREHMGTQAAPALANPQVSAQAHVEPPTPPALPTLPDLPRIESGRINPPEAPAVPALNLTQLGAMTTPPALPTAQRVATAAASVVGNIDTMSRDELKDLAIKRNLIDGSSKLREASLRDLLKSNGVVPSAPPAVATGVSMPVQPTAVPFPTKPVDVDERITIYIGCMPMNEEVISLANLLTPVLDHLQETTKLTHWGLEDFSKGGARLAAALDSFMAAYDKCPNIYVDPRSHETTHCLPVLMRYADKVVRAVF